MAGLAVAFAAPALAVTQVLMPNVSYSREVQFTAHGPVVLHVITAPRPGGLYQLKPILSNGAITGTERVTSMQKDISDSATVAGVNGDLFNFNDGHPSGMLMQGGVLQSPPYRFRSSIGITSDGKLSVGRVAFFGYWQGLGQRRPLTGLNQPPRGDGTALFTPAWGAATPKLAGAVEAVIEPFPAAVPGQDLSGTVTIQTTGGGTPIPRDGAVLVAHGSQAAKLASEAPPPARVITHLILSPDWLASGVTDALGGGPVIVKNGKAVYTAGEDFLPTQLAPRNPRTAVGQRKDGKIVLIAADGRRPGYSSGLTNWELAQTMVRHGVVTGSALDAGGSTTMAFDGQLLNRPSDPGGERSVAESLSVLYTGVYAPPPALTVVSPNGDGIAEKQLLAFKVVRPSTVTMSLVGPGGAIALTQTDERQPGIYKVSWPSAASRRQAQPLGRWRWVVTATDDLAPEILRRALVLAERHARVHARRARGGQAAPAHSHRRRGAVQGRIPGSRDAFDLDDERRARAPPARQVARPRHPHDRLERPVCQRTAGLPRQIRLQGLRAERLRARRSGAAVHRAALRRSA